MTMLPPLAAWLHEQERVGKFKSLRQIAKYGHLAPDTVWRIYTGEVTRPTPETMAKLATFFDVSKDELMALAGYVSAPPRISPEERLKMDRDRLIDVILADRTSDQKLALLPEDVRDNISLHFVRPPRNESTHDFIVDAAMRAWLARQSTETLERLSKEK